MIIKAQNALSGKIVGAAIAVHRVLGPALFFELNGLGFMVRKQVPVDILYKGQKLEVGYRIDLLVEA